jgi:hydrogenase maturation protein HypF
MPTSGGEEIRVRGIVQGVGFRPMVWRLARACGLTGSVWNDAAGVVIHLHGPAEMRHVFVARLAREAPPLARIDALERSALAARSAPADFRIVASRGGEMQTAVAPDAAACAACLAEVEDSGDRRHRYAFTNCTHCGPRLSIVRAVPYDRARTSMAPFPLCESCRAEYEDPADRRFHAQPNACPDCGPRLWLEPCSGAERDPCSGAERDPCSGAEREDDGPATGEAAEPDAIAHAARLLAAGRIVAVKGLGGFHLAVDAANEAAVARLRRRKRRASKPLALMARDVETIRRYCRVDAAEQALLESRAAPVVLLERAGPRELAPGAAPRELALGAAPRELAPGVAPRQRTLGFTLPYTPLHRLLVDALDGPIVLTSGNLSDAPQCTGNAEARNTLGAIADYLLVHDRAIVNRVDDSVARVIDGAPRLIRRARGYAPAPLELPDGFGAAPPVLALGGELKNSFCLLRDGGAVLSQHMGDLEHAAAYREYRRSLQLYARLFDHAPEVLAVDRHPEYLSTKLGTELAAETGLTLTHVQHHHAHLASCLADNAVSLHAPAVLGVVLDGLGYGHDGTLWGGEFLLGGYRECRRVASLASVPMLGGARAVHEPWRSAYAHIVGAIGRADFARDFARLELYGDLAARPLDTLDAMLARGFNCPASTSCGRLFDAVAAALGICRERIEYEGQAAIELEACVDEAALAAAGDGYPFSLVDAPERLVLDSRPLWPALLEDLARRVPKAVVAAKFHRGLARAVAATVRALRREPRGHGFEQVALSGGVFQNAVLLEELCVALRAQGLDVLLQGRVPSNDGGLALGQAAVAAARALPHRQTRRTAACA